MPKRGTWENVLRHLLPLPTGGRPGMALGHRSDACAGERVMAVEFKVIDPIIKDLNP